MKTKKMLKRVCLLALAAACAVTPLSGCGKKSAEEPIIHWYMIKSVDTMEHQEEIESLANEKFEKEIGVKVKFHFLDNAAWEDKMNVMINSGEEFDICFTSSWTNKFIDNVRRDAFVPMDKKMLEKYAPDILKKSDDRVWDAVTIDGKIYAIPSQAPMSSSSAMVFKKDLVDKYNFDYKNVKTLSDLEPYLKLIKENEPGITPMLQTAGGGVSTYIDENYTDDQIKGLDFSEKDQKFVNAMKIPERVEKWRKLSEFYKKGYIPLDAATRTEYMSDAKTGKYAVLKTTGAYTENGEKSTSYYGFPCVEAYEGNSAISNGVVTSSMSAISASSKHPEEALQVLNLVWKDPDLSNLLAYGIEGTDYVIDEERSTPDMKSIIPNSGKNQKWAIWHNYLGPLWDQWDSSWNRKEALEKMQEENKKAEVSSTLGFYFDSSSVKAECAAVASTVKEYGANLNVGSVADVDAYLAEAYAKLEQNGIDKIIEEANRQYSEWKANKK